MLSTAGNKQTLLLLLLLPPLGISCSGKRLFLSTVLSSDSDCAKKEEEGKEWNLLFGQKERCLGSANDSWWNKKKGKRGRRSACTINSAQPTNQLPCKRRRKKERKKSTTDSPNKNWPSKVFGPPFSRGDKKVQLWFTESVFFLVEKALASVLNKLNWAVLKHSTRAESISAEIFITLRITFSSSCQNCAVGVTTRPGVDQQTRSLLGLSPIKLRLYWKNTQMNWIHCPPPPSTQH